MKLQDDRKQLLLHSKYRYRKRSVQFKPQ